MIEAHENIKELFIEEEMKSSYLTFAMSVIVSRALPDVRDGLKPSQRRILVAMNDLALSPRAKFRKCAKIAGDTTGNYHPHGEQVVYPTLVRMAQDFNLRYTLIEGQGNFGSIDGDPPAAMRYTEARLTEASMAILEDLEKDTVDFVPNYDGTRQEPTVLPSAFPNLLCNGSSGIAVGMATSVPPNNVGEICDGILKVLGNPRVSIDELLTIVKGPDFPTGGIICGSRGIVQGYKTGRGSVTVRARTHIEEMKGSRKQIVVTEIPYQLNRDKVIERIAELVKLDKITGISDIRNESDREGSRLVMELKRGEDENVVLNQLYNLTQLQDNFSIIMIALVDGRPQTLNLKELLLAYRDYRMEVVRRRTSFLLKKAEERAHIVEGLRIGLKNIDDVVAVIKASADAAAAKMALVERFGLSEMQAGAILDMRLQRLTSLEHTRLEEEYDQLCKDISRYRDILAKEELVLNIIREEIQTIREKFGDARRTDIMGEVEDFTREELITEEDMAVLLTHRGYIKRMPLTAYRRQGRGGKGVMGGDLEEGDFVEHLFIASTHDYLLFFTDQGRVYWQKVYDIPQQGRLARGRAIINLLGIKAGESITAMFPVREFDARHLVMVTEKGTIKKTPLTEFRNPKRGGIIAVKLREGDKLVGVRLTTGNEELIIGSENGKAMRFHEKEVRPMGRTAAGVRGIRLKEGDRVKGLVVVEEGATLLTVCENGYGKRTAFDEYPTHGRGGQGVMNIKTTERNGKVVALVGVRDKDELMLLTAGGKVVRTDADSLSTIGRGTQGVRVVSLDEGDRVASMACIAEEKLPETSPEGQDPAESPDEELETTPTAESREITE
ncbi:MAG: DNA gyrase subunit A [Planctomycetes bacterium GWA2_50_13]|nr:MAG: DNA gyrase subunit A [Planctomycetes bacterium GWA2_50_13]OHB91752.1 MAG: DNA gyrase subunit A [Planctomycetes bacterium RIFCSPHIGHO2_12_FULL_51_37]HCN20557.1 DNA gyrase subunit A [Planctomycetia bacterium]